MAISGLIAASPAIAPGYLTYSPGEERLPIGFIILGAPLLVAGMVLWSGVTLPLFCRRLIKHHVNWRRSTQNRNSRFCCAPALLLGAGAALIALGAADACADVSWLHPAAWVLTGAACAFAAFAAANLLLYKFVTVPKWLQPKAHRCQARATLRGPSRLTLRKRNRAALISLYVDRDDIEAFEHTGVLPPRRRPSSDASDDWLRAQGPLGGMAADELQRERDEELPRQRDVDRL